MERAGRPPRKMIIVSVGTGVSYTKVRGRKAKRSPLGSAHGGGTILGLGKIIGAKSFKELEEAAFRGVPADLLVKDRLPETAGTMLGQLVIAHFCKDGASFEDRCASVFSFAAGSIAKDLAVLTSIPFSPKDIAVIGTVAASPVFRRVLEGWAPFLKDCRLHFPENGEYAAALGAWADIST
jgi:pantothenate kinase